jgi:hypothetical protein
MALPSGGGYSTPTVRGPDFSNASRMIGSTAELLQAPVPEPFFRTAEFVDRMWGSVANLGVRGMKVAEMMGDYALNLQRVRDEGSLSKANNMIDERYAEFADKMSSRPAAEWMPEWQEKVVPKLLKEIGSLPISNNGKAKMQVAVDGALTKHTVNTRLRADKATMDETDASLLAERERYEYQGNWEGAAAIDAKRKFLGLISEGQRQQEEVQRMKKMDTQAIQNFVNTDAFEAKTHFATAMSKGKSDLFPNMSASQLASAFESSDAMVRTIQREGRESIDNLIIREPVTTTPEQIRSVAESIKLPEKEIEQMIADRGVMYQATPEGKAQFLQAQRDLYGKVAAYDPATDLAGVEIRYLTETTPAAVVVARGEAAGQAAAQISKLVLSPNPASDELFLEAYFPDACEDAPAVADAFVYDAGGRLRMVRESLPCDGAAVRARLQVGELPAGVYWVQVVRGGVRVQGKLIKQP